MNAPAISSSEEGSTLLAIARQTLASDLGEGEVSIPTDDWLRQEGACFVTLHRRGELRGCIGTLLAHRPLVKDLQANTRAAAFSDPRFPPLEPHELSEVTLEVSLLSALEPMEFTSEADLIRQLEPGVDGLLLEEGFCRGTFLPAVWRSLPEPSQFLAKLKAKAGLSEEYWSDEIRVRRYTTRSWSEDSSHRGR